MSPRRRILRSLALFVIALPSLAANPAASQRAERASPPAQNLAVEAPIWNEFFGGCLAEAPGREYACACAASWSLGACRAQRAGLLACLERMKSEPSYGPAIRAHCGDYGNMSTVGIPNAEPRRAPPAPHHLTAWNGGFNGCLTSATPEEHRTSDAIRYTCACVTTYLINACIAAPGASAEAYGECVNRHAADIQNAGRECLRYGHLEVR